MWLSKQVKPVSPTADADLGVTTIAGNGTGVITRGEVRSLPVYGPGGYIWLPGNGEEVLVIKGGPGGEEQCVAGTRQSATPKEMLPGEVYLYGPGGNAVYLKKDGTVELQGTISIKGELVVNGEAYKPCRCEGGLT
jgi:phage gp45-like